MTRAQGTDPLTQQQSGLMSQYGDFLRNQMNTNYADIAAQLHPFETSDIMSQAAQGAQRAGFYDAPGTSPVGSALAGPALAQRAGQVGSQRAQALMAMATQMPGSIGQGMNAFNNFQNQQMANMGAAANAMQGGFGAFNNLSNQQVNLMNALAAGLQAGGSQYNTPNQLGMTAQGNMGTGLGNVGQQYGNLFSDPMFRQLFAGGQGQNMGNYLGQGLAGMFSGFGQGYGNQQQMNQFGPMLQQWMRQMQQGNQGNQTRLQGGPQQGTITGLGGLPGFDPNQSYE